MFEFDVFALAKKRWERLFKGAATEFGNVKLNMWKLKNSRSGSH